MEKINGMWKNNLQLIAFGMCLAWSYLMVYTFFVAFFSGKMRVIVTVNDLGEAGTESIVIPIILIYCSIMFLWFFVDWIKEVNKRKVE